MLRIGGPSLLYAFSQQNKLPCASYIYKLVHNEINFKLSYMESIKKVVDYNISQFYKESNGFFSIKLDEIALVPRARWSSENNEVIGFCYNHKHEINSFKFETHLSVNEIKKKF